MKILGRKVRFVRYGRKYSGTVKGQMTINSERHFIVHTESGIGKFQDTRFVIPASKVKF